MKNPAHGDNPSAARRPLRTRYPDLSPRSTFSRTCPPSVPADLALWDSWSDSPVEQLDVDLFDDEGNPVEQQGRSE
jgi:hypothetical protein